MQQTQPRRRFRPIRSGPINWGEIMTIGVGGSSAESELGQMTSMRDGVEPISDQELRTRIEKAQRLMREQGIQALYLDASTSLFYFTGLRLGVSERLHGAVIPDSGDVAYLCRPLRKPRPDPCCGSGTMSAPGKSMRIPLLS